MNAYLAYHPNAVARDATRLAYLLDRLARVIEGGLLEQRIEMLERVQCYREKRPRVISRGSLA
jgi:hypothetical protein